MLNYVYWRGCNSEEWQSKLMSSNIIELEPQQFERRMCEIASLIQHSNSVVIGTNVGHCSYDVETCIHRWSFKIGLKRLYMCKILHFAVIFSILGSLFILFSNSAIFTISNIVRMHVRVRHFTTCILRHSQTMFTSACMGTTFCFCQKYIFWTSLTFSWLEKPPLGANPEANPFELWAVGVECLLPQKISTGRKFLICWYFVIKPDSVLLLRSFGFVYLFVEI